jgi:uncharacterized protein YndB with AHSA1/START domain
MTEQLAVHKSIVVNRPVDVCFKVFTEEISSWWPLHEGFSFGGEKAKDMFVEGFVGGRVYERFTDGQEYTVGEVLEYDPPSLFTFSWNHTGIERPTRVEVRFTAEGDATRVDLIHDGWEDAGLIEEAASYDGGWDFVLSKFQAVLP